MTSLSKGWLKTFDISHQALFSIQIRTSTNKTQIILGSGSIPPSISGTSRTKCSGYRTPLSGHSPRFPSPKDEVPRNYNPSAVATKALAALTQRSAAIPPSRLRSTRVRRSYSPPAGQLWQGTWSSRKLSPNAVQVSFQWLMVSGYFCFASLSLTR